MPQMFTGQKRKKIKIKINNKQYEREKNTSDIQNDLSAMNKLPK